MQRSSCKKTLISESEQSEIDRRQMKRSNVVNLKTLTLTARTLRKRKMHGKTNGRKEVGPWTQMSMNHMV